LYGASEAIDITYKWALREGFDRLIEIDDTDKRTEKQERVKAAFKHPCEELLDFWTQMCDLDRQRQFQELVKDEIERRQGASG
jgi:hypothetical protein